MARARSRLSADSTRAVGPASTSSRASSRRWGSRAAPARDRAARRRRCAARRASAGSPPSGRRRSWNRWRQTARPAARGRRPAAAAARTARAGTGRPRGCRSAVARSPTSPTASMACRASWMSARLGGAEAAEARPAAEQHRVEYRDRERTVDLGLLRQVGDALGRAFDAAFDVRRQPEQRLQERALARAVGPDDGRHLGGRDLGRHVMHRRMAVVAHGQVDQRRAAVTAPTRRRATIPPTPRARPRSGRARSWRAGSCRARRVRAWTASVGS